VDADRLATEAFCNPEKHARRAAPPVLADLEAKLNAHLARFTHGSAVNRARATVLADCRAAAALEPGLFSLTAPTGCGKTLSGMAFALAHARLHDLRRVVVVVPYTSIIEQNAAAYREAMGRDSVLEHHCNVDPTDREEVEGEAAVRLALAAENWDAPIVVTTTVQFFESLYSNRPAACRKLHNIARSVVILDEAQCLPAGFLECLLDAMRQVTTCYGVSLVISTATQPALGRRETLSNGLEGVREIVREPQALAAGLQRVRVSWPADLRTPEPYAQLARRITARPRVLVVVHGRRDARTLAELLPEEGRFHLSALMCPAHRLEKLDAIRKRLQGGGVCRTVATQLVEAGVDLDFPVVFRALAGLDSLAQAAGRCNREGGRDRGEFVVFRAETSPPPGALAIALEAAEAVLAEYGLLTDLTDPGAFQEFFRLFYHRSELDRRGVQSKREGLNFASVARSVQLIEDGYLRPVVVPWAQGPARLAAYEQTPSRDTARVLQPFVVQIPVAAAERLLQECRLRPVTETLLAVETGAEALYSAVYGLLLEPGDEVPTTPLIA
jgi:CRISPR-associated endonuclease/helicase Cas3